MQTQFENSGVKYLAVGVPEGTYDFEVKIGAMLFSSLVGYDKYGTMKYVERLPKSNWEILGTYPGLSEEICAGMVELLDSYDSEDGKRTINVFKNYNSKYKFETGFISSTESFASFMESMRCYLVNDMEKPTMEKYGYVSSNSFDEPSGWMIEGGEEANYELLDLWQQAQDRTFKQFIILKQV